MNGGRKTQAISANTRPAGRSEGRRAEPEAAPARPPHPHLSVLEAQ